MTTVWIVEEYDGESPRLIAVYRTELSAKTAIAQLLVGEFDGYTYRIHERVVQD